MTSRRQFLAGALAAATTKPEGNPQIGVVSWSFRNYFKVPQRGRPSPTPIPPEKMFDMLAFPGIVKERFGLALLDLVNKHLSSTEPAYLEKLSRAVADAGCKVWNVKVDVRANISDPDPQARKESVEQNLSWIDVSARLASPCMRVNSGHFLQGKRNILDTIDSYKRLAGYGKQRGVKIIVENHGGVTASPDAILEILDAVKDNIASGPDTRSFPDEVLHSGLKKIFPFAATCDVKTMDIGSGGEHQAYDLQRCLEIAAAAGYKGPWMIEFVGRNQDPFEGVARSRDLLLKWLKRSH